MRIAVAGSSGYVGSHLVARLRAAGHEVLALVRRPPRAGDEVQWDPATESLDVARLEGVQAGINLAGAGLAGKRWDAEYKRLARSSRTDSARTFSAALAHVGAGVLLQASAIGYYGQDVGGVRLTEASGPGTDFLADLCLDWESATRPALDAGLRVAYLRTGLVMGPDGGAFAPLLRTMRFGLGGRLGDGNAWWSWITMPDEVGAIAFLLENDIDGPVNLVSPNPATNAEITQVLARALHRPALFRVPELALRVGIGEFADEILASRRVEPTVLLDAGYQFQHPDLVSAARWISAN